MLLKGVSESKTSSQIEQELEIVNDFLISFKYIDPNQGQTLEQWEKEGILARAIETLKNYCCSSLLSQIDKKKSTIYGSFPPKNKTDFEKPKHVPEDAQWARIHITGTQILAGYINRNVFNVVFLDKEHGFYKSEKKHT